MSERITLAEVAHVARLARLSLAPQEMEAMQKDLSAILDFMKALEQLNTEGVEPTYHPTSNATPFRADTTFQAFHREEFLRSAPKVDAFAFAVPKVKEGE